MSQSQMNDPQIATLIARLKDKNNAMSAVFALTETGDTVTVPRKILAFSQFSAKERIDVLESLPRARYHLLAVRTLCQTVLNEEDVEARIGAQTVLNWLNGDQNLLHPSQRDTAHQAQELLRAAQGGTSDS